MGVDPKIEKLSPTTTMLAKSAAVIDSEKPAGTFLKTNGMATT